MSELVNTEPKATPKTLMSPTHEMTRAERDTFVRAQIFMLPKYQIIRDPLDKRLYAPNKKVKKPQNYMAEAQTMIGHLLIEGGCGFAAPQMGLNLQMFVVKPPDWPKAVVFFNARIIGEAQAEEPEMEWSTEGCISHPGIWLDICRPKKVIFRASTITKPEESTYYAAGIFGRTVMHEIDHTRPKGGQLITDNLFRRNLVVDPVGQSILFKQNVVASEHGRPDPEID